MRAEVRGRGKEWRVFYTDESALASPFPVFDRDGVLAGVVMAGSPTTKEMTESRAVFESADEAGEYARWLGADEVVVKRTMTREQSLAKARAVRKEVTEGD